MWRFATGFFLVFKQENIIFSQKLEVLKAGSLSSRCHQFWFLLRPLSMACRQLSSPCVPTWPYLCVHQHSVFQGHLCCSIYPYVISFYCQIIFCCMDRLHLFIHPSFGWFPLFGYHKSCHYRHLCTSFYLDICFWFSWVDT